MKKVYVTVAVDIDDASDPRLKTDNMVKAFAGDTLITILKKVHLPPVIKDIRIRTVDLG